MKRIQWSFLLPILAAAFAGYAAPVLACTTHKIATPEELVARADAIYRARAEDYVIPLAQRRPGVPPQIRFAVLEALKGSKQSIIQFPGAFTESDDPNDESVPYTFIRPGGRHGNCYAVTYQRAQEYLLFIRSGTPYWARLAPTNEQIKGPSDPWVVWVRVQRYRQHGITNH